jgi:phosphomannomutase/phosphoglucomutase
MLDNKSMGDNYRMTRLFGTNGIRGVVNKEMTGELALGIGAAWGTLLKQTLHRPRVALGSDARISRDMLKSAITAGFLSTGCDIVDAGLLPTPALQYLVKIKSFDSGVIITASHNPPQFNGIKGVAEDGTEFSKEVEEQIEHFYFSQDYTVADWEQVGTATTWDGAIELYLNGIFSTVDIILIKKQKFHVVLDCGNGAGAVVTPLLLKKLGCKVTPVFCEVDGTFSGRPSEPLQENLHQLIKTVQDADVVFGVAQDGDADRAIFIDDHGQYIWGDQSLSLVGKFIIKENQGGTAVTPVTTSSCFEEVITQHGGRVIYTQVGSPIVARVMKKQNAIFGGEENGGLIFPQLQYCRDSAMSIAKMLEILAREQRLLSELVAELPTFEVYKTKLSCPNDKKQLVLDALVQHVKVMNKIQRVDQTDGVKLYMDDGWVLLRPSGTEPIFRVYAEAKTRSQVEQLVSTYKKLVEDIITELTT